MPNYTKSGKRLDVLSVEDFKKGMIEGKFCKRNHRGLAALLYYTGVRISEALRAKKEQFILTDSAIFFEVGKRLKHGIKTPPLKILKKRAFVAEIIHAVESTEPKKRVWPYWRSTGYNVVNRAFNTYPHHFRLSRVMLLLDKKKFSIPKVRMWTGLSLPALNYYVGTTEIDEMAEA